MSQLIQLTRRWQIPLITALLATMSGLAAWFLLRQRILREPAGRPDRSRSIAPEVLAELSGLTEDEAAQRRIPVNHEALKKEETRRFWRQMLRNHLLTFFNLDMIGVAILMYLLGSPWSTILTLLLLVASVGLNLFQELYTKRKLDGLLAQLQPQATVIRESRVHSIPLEEIVVGDHLVVTIGDRIVADGEIVGHGQLWVEEADKKGGLIRRQKRTGDPVTVGTICTQGQAVYRVNQFDPHSAISQRMKASLLPSKLTPLQRLIERIFQLLFILVVVFTVLLLADVSTAWLGIPLFDGVLVRDAVSQIFAIAPTSLFMMIAVNYAMGLARVAEVGALVYRSDTIEALANTSVICFSTGGTLTGQQVTLEPAPSSDSQEHLSETRVRQLLGSCVHSVQSSNPIRLALADAFPAQPRAITEVAPFFSAHGWSGVSFEQSDMRGTYIIGAEELLEQNLEAPSEQNQHDAAASDVAQPQKSGRWRWLPRFGRSASSASQRETQETNVSPAAGEPAGLAAENSADSALKIVVAAELPSTPPDEQAADDAYSGDQPTFRQRWGNRLETWFAPSETEVARTKQREQEAAQEPDIRLLFAYLPEPVPLHNATGWPQLPQGLKQLGSIQLTQQVRPEALNVVQSFVEAGVSIKLISADPLELVTTTAEQLNLTGAETTTVVTGDNLQRMGTRAFRRTVQENNLFARLSPVQRARIVAELRRQGAYVTVVGGEVDDLPAMQQANISVAAEPSNQATMTNADIVLLKNSLHVLPEILQLGQRVVNGLLDTFKLYLTHIAAHLILLLIYMGILAVPFPYSSTQASIISVFGITFPAVFLPFFATIGRVSPRMTFRQMLHFVVPAAVTTAVLAIGIYSWGLFATGDIISTRLTVTFALVAVAFLRIIFVKPPGPFWSGANSLSDDRRPVWLTVASAAIFVVFVVLTAMFPLFQSWFDMDLLSRPQDYVLAAVGVLLWLFITRALWRMLQRRYDNRLT
jgi:magnesium-transporting ATPase (P-type)